MAASGKAVGGLAAEVGTGGPTLSEHTFAAVLGAYGTVRVEETRLATSLSTGGQGAKVG